MSVAAPQQKEFDVLRALVWFAIGTLGALVTALWISGGGL
jgi:hypothetical protein